MKLVRFLKPMPQHSANIGDEMGFDDATAASLVANRRAELVVVTKVEAKEAKQPAEEEIKEEEEVDSLRAAKRAELLSPPVVGAVVELDAAPEIVAKAGPLSPEADPVRGDYEDEPVRRGPGRPRKHS